MAATFLVFCVRTDFSEGLNNWLASMDPMERASSNFNFVKSGKSVTIACDWTFVTCRAAELFFGFLYEKMPPLVEHLGEKMVFFASFVA